MNNIPGDHATYRDNFIRLLELFRFTWDGYLGHIRTAPSRVELDPPITKPIHSVPYRAGPKTRDFEKNEINNMLSMNVN